MRLTPQAANGPPFDMVRPQSSPARPQVPYLPLQYTEVLVTTPRSSSPRFAQFSPGRVPLLAPRGRTGSTSAYTLQQQQQFQQQQLQHQLQQQLHLQLPQNTHSPRFG